MNLLFHIATADAWREARALGEYRPASLAAEGFIHCSESQQLLEVAERLFGGRTDLLLLGLDPAHVGAPLVYENLEDGDDSEQYPHLYGPLPLAAVTRCWQFQPGEDGQFALPADLAGGGDSL